MKQGWGSSIQVDHKKPRNFLQLFEHSDHPEEKLMEPNMKFNAHLPVFSKFQEREWSIKWVSDLMFIGFWSLQETRCYKYEIPQHIGEKKDD